MCKTPKAQASHGFQALHLEQRPLLCSFSCCCFVINYFIGLYKHLSRWIYYRDRKSVSAPKRKAFFSSLSLFKRKETSLTSRRQSEPVKEENYGLPFTTSIHEGSFVTHRISQRAATCLSTTCFSFRGSPSS